MEVQHRHWPNEKSITEAEWFNIGRYEETLNWGLNEWFHAVSNRISLVITVRGWEREGPLDPDYQRRELIEHVAAITQPSGVNTAAVSPLSKGSGMVWADPSRRNVITRDATRHPSVKIFREDDIESYWKNHQEFVYTAVDLGAPDDVIVDDFKAWLKVQRDRAATRGEDRPKKAKVSAITRAKLLQWASARSLAYIDLTLYLDVFAPHVRKSEVHSALFPGHEDVEGQAKVCRKHARTILSVSTYRALASQVAGLDRLK